jgi:hypothetical protein
MIGLRQNVVFQVKSVPVPRRCQMPPGTDLQAFDLAEGARQEPLNAVSASRQDFLIDESLHRLAPQLIRPKQRDPELPEHPVAAASGHCSWGLTRQAVTAPTGQVRIQAVPLAPRASVARPSSASAVRRSSGKQGPRCPDMMRVLVLLVSGACLTIGALAQGARQVSRAEVSEMRDSIGSCLRKHWRLPTKVQPA